MPTSSSHSEQPVDVLPAVLRVAFLIGADTPSTRFTIEQVCNLTCIHPLGILVDTARPPFSRRVKNLRRNIRREGIGYAGRRMIRTIRERLDSIAAQVIPESEKEDLLRKAFPERCFSLDEIASRFQLPIWKIGNMNGQEAARRLRECGATLGIVLGTRILKSSTFKIPELGCLNLHKGSVPEFRGMPPGFWELYEGSPTAGITVHFVDDGLDTGDIVAASEFPIHARETFESLKVKLDLEGARVLCKAISGVASGTATRRPQPASKKTPRTKPTRVQELELLKRRNTPRSSSDLKQILKTAFYLFLFHSGIYRFLKNKARRPYGRGAIVLYHRVNDVSSDPLTTSRAMFVEHLVMLRQYYRVIDTNSLVGLVRQHGYIPPGTVAIHFDDCYRGVFTDAAPLLKAAGMPATMFISSGFIDTDRVFAHDADKYPHSFENLRREDIAGLMEAGIDIAAHTVNHVNLGVVNLDEARQEVTCSKQALEALSGREVPFFSFPFGRREHFQPEVREIVESCGFQALFSAYGGFVSGESDPYDIPRNGASSEHRALDLMMELEGLSLAHFARWLRGRAS